MAGHLGGVESRLRAAVAERLGEARFGLWFGEGVQLGMAGDALEVGVPNAFFREWIQGHFAGNLIAAAEEVTGGSVRLAFRVDDEAEPKVGHVVDVPEPGAAAAAGGEGAAGARARPRLRRLRPGTGPGTSNRPPRRLEDFVTGPGNRLAHAAALEMVQSVGATFNPLVIHGGVGLGKTHLLEGDRPSPAGPVRPG